MSTIKNETNITNTTNIIETETLKKLKEKLKERAKPKIDTWEDLKACLKNINHFNKKNFLQAMELNDEDLKDIGLDNDNEELYKNKEIWIKSIDQAIEQQPKKQDSAAIITSNGSFIMEVCGENKQKTIKSVCDAYEEFTGKKPPKANHYKSQKEFLEAAENQNLPGDVKQAVCNAGFPATIYTLKFDSEEEYQNFQKKIQDLFQDGKLRYLGNAPMSSPQPSPTPVEQGTLNAKSSPLPFKLMSEPLQPSASTSTAPNPNQDINKNLTADESTQRSSTPSLKP